MVMVERFLDIDKADLDMIFRHGQGLTARGDLPSSRNILAGKDLWCGSDVEQVNRRGVEPLVSGLKGRRLDRSTSSPAKKKARHRFLVTPGLASSLSQEARRHKSAQRAGRPFATPSVRCLAL